MRAEVTEFTPVSMDYLQTDSDVATERVPATVMYGYVRAPIGEDSEAAQRSALHAAGVPDDCIFADTDYLTHGAESKYARMLQTLRTGDVLVVASIDRLGNTYDEVMAQWQMLTRARNIRVVVLDIPLLDMRTKRHQMSDSFVSDLALQFLAYVATREREGIRQRQREGILAAKSRGVRFGRPPKPIPPQFDMLLTQWKAREISSRKAAQQLGVAQETFLRWARKKG